MRYVVKPVPDGYQVIDSSVGLPVTLGMMLNDTTTSETAAERYAATLNRCAEQLGVVAPEPQHT
ncbi:MAG TPA: hypothetical protein VHY35_10585 [Stellaceae bacterium]|jgi:hypothetical protein|nr:hypothetical protein [Stellaceae bacterium]